MRALYYHGGQAEHTHTHTCARKRFIVTHLLVRIAFDFGCDVLLVLRFLCFEQPALCTASSTPSVRPLRFLHDAL